ncbi:hypothetical protein COT62_00690 [Candidatus Roizmanbacteria bacterium CG09_land_8_20_14_0_10_41_9]|uniref:Multidrug ABC transporter substrate-binding protein n=1 Tax=Candidatus Roizmanbacteria bacterium CG09_land_8_20_14_0_10_41_9 TaxID=1974850 RepID=A0A2H0WTP8_9BACT|nr:MAG: hypothetical protein COT62_00690 [Candidatus Roizmanbacteria bacterium CG09_land_8_20_14_0_10_41_9]
MKYIRYLVFTIKSAFFDFSRSKGRTFLTSLGILIGVMAVVLLMVLGLGLKRYIEQQFESLGSNLMYVMPGSKATITRGGGIVGGIKFDDKDVRTIEKVKSITYIAPGYAKAGSTVEANGKTEIVEIVGSSEQIVPMFNLEVEYGRLMEKKDVQKGGKVIMLSTTVVEKLFDSAEESVGKNVTMENQNFKIIGVIKSKGGGGLGGGGLDDHAYIPFKATYSFNPDKKFYAIYFKAENKDAIPQIKEDVQRLLERRYDKDDFSVLEQKEIMETISSIFSIINTVLVAIAAISLVVGGIGIMNIMYVTVTERIREIGIRRALGAKKSDILAQFLTESVILSLIGGILGLTVSYVIVFFLQSLFPAYIDAQSIILALGVSSAIGIIFGVFPAKKAADLTPMDAIRYE